MNKAKPPDPSTPVSLAEYYEQRGHIPPPPSVNVPGSIADHESVRLFENGGSLEDLWGMANG